MISGHFQKHLADAQRIQIQSFYIWIIRAGVADISGQYLAAGNESVHTVAKIHKMCNKIFRALDGKIGKVNIRKAAADFSFR